MSENHSYLRMEQITKTFGPVIALKEVTFSARPGQVHALCGENGAGKSTLMKVLAGVYRPDNGRIFIDEKEMSFTHPGQAMDAGISILYQELDLAEHLTVYENIFLGREIKSSIPFVIDRKAMISQTQKLCKQYGFDIDPMSQIRRLTTGQCQIVELLKALMRNAKIIVMDEPTSSLSESESKRLFEIIRELRQKNLTIIYISHRMEEVKLLADQISVLRDGETVGSGPSSEMDIHKVIRLMVGRELNEYYPPREPKIGSVFFEAEKLASEEGINDVTFNVSRGEIVGMAGLVGAGRTEVARAIFGIKPLTAGSIKIDGKTIKIRKPSDAVRNRIAFLTEDRKRSGLCLNLPCSWNMTLPNYRTIGMKTLLNLRKEEQLCQTYGEKVSVRWTRPGSPANSLSGGNQQKLLIGRWLMADSDFIIFDEPTRGIDIGAKKEVFILLNELAAEGKAILIISSELQELLGICDRILVMRRGRIAGNLETTKTTQEEIMHLAAVGK